MKGLQISQKLLHEKLYVHKKILRTQNCHRKFIKYLLHEKRTQKICKPNYRELNRDWIKLLKKTHRNTKIRITIKRKYRVKKNQNAPPNEKETSKKITKKNRNSSPQCKRMYIIGDSILKHVQGYEISKSLENRKTWNLSQVLK